MNGKTLAGSFSKKKKSFRLQNHGSGGVIRIQILTSIIAVAEKEEVATVTRNPIRVTVRRWFVWSRLPACLRNQQLRSLGPFSALHGSWPIGLKYEGLDTKLLFIVFFFWTVMIWKLKFYVPSLNLLYTVDEMMTSCLLVQALTRNHHMETHLCTSHFVRDGITSVHTLDNSTLVYVLNIHIGQLICFLGLQFFHDPLTLRLFPAG